MRLSIGTALTLSAKPMTPLEREEEALIEIAQAQGHDVPRRPNASPAVVLGVIVKERPLEAVVSDDDDDETVENETADDETAEDETEI
jgi:hypothetical protein